jgi:hypothetical protein
LAKTTSSASEKENRASHEHCRNRRPERLPRGGLVIIQEFFGINIEDFLLRIDGQASAGRSNAPSARNAASTVISSLCNCLKTCDGANLRPCTTEQI